MSKIRILIAEDSLEWQKYHVSLLNRYNDMEHQRQTEFTIANNARDALELVELNAKEQIQPFDLVFSDMQMETEFLPEFAGEWLVKQLKQLPSYKNTKIVVVSAAYNIGFIASRLGVDYLSKRSIINYPEAYFSVLDKL